ncbi:hypothetical protein D3C85_1406830 [compost metagenome]
MLVSNDRFYEIGYLVCILAQRLMCNLLVQHQRGNICMVRGNLSNPLVAIVRADASNAHILGSERFYTLDFHNDPFTVMNFSDIVSKGTGNSFLNKFNIFKYLRSEELP